MGGLLSRAARRGARSQIRYVRLVPPGSARGLVGQVYAQVERDFGMLAPPIVLHSPASGPLAAAWLMLRETMLVPGLADRAAKEAVAVAVSHLNACPYCVDVHSAALHGLGQAADAVALAEDKAVDTHLHDIVGWARTSGRRRQAKRAHLPVPVAQMPELIGTVVTFHYLNRMVNLFLTGSPIPLGLPPAVRRGARRVAGRMLRSALQSEPAPGAALELLPAAPLPPDLTWAAGNPTLGQAFARAAAAIDAAGRRSVPDPVRELVGAMLADWGGEAPGVLRDWAYDAVAVLPREDRPAGQLALLTAFSSYQVGASVIDGFREHSGSDDQRLIEVASWASLAAARVQGSWLWRAEERNVEDADERRSYKP
jgi:AhpD family alkylhydroperoxidase